MANLYLTEQGSVLRKTGDRLIVQKDDEILLDVQCHKIDAVLIFGNVQFTTQSVHELFEHGIEMALLTKTGRLIGQITSPFTKNINLRIKQFKKYEDIDFRIRFAISIMKGKIRNSLQFLRSFAYNHPQIDINDELHRVEGCLKSLDNQTTLEGLNGVEGTAAREFFSAYGKMMLGNLDFNGRKKRPPTDPVNALLSFGYTLVFNEISSFMDGMGFDPYLGYYHKVDYGRASLASDILEEFRTPIVDRLTLRLVNKKILKEDNFYLNPQGGMYLKREGMKRYFVEYEDWMNREFTLLENGERTTFRRCFRLQAEKLAACIREEKEYTPFLLKT
ncbi:MAG: CRISPR-associated Cas1 family protein [Candidatus Scalindua rubra]|uniref:CRISPR-associated endonuclease Cas1 n=1 Tax=Candidatus Scalindua rubra TaxID=1872076 RepID=A0A1E3X5H1_9BACT|nr:MAG: CRISPR-associated Cas1 family protein [Candidatus Scalindua rubra]